MMRQPDGHILTYRDGQCRPVRPQSLERMIRGSGVVGFWRVWSRA